jgi:WD40 repeat protein
MTSTKFISIILALLLTVSATFAQETEPAAVNGVREIPLEGKGLQMEVAPNGQVAAIFENYVILGNTVEPELLPIRLVDIATGEILFYLAGQTDYAIDAVFSPDSSQLVSFHGNGYIYVWDVATGEQIRMIPSFIGGGRMEFLPDGHTLAIQQSGTLSNIFLLDIETGNITAVYNQHLTMEQVFEANGLLDNYITVAVSPDGSSIVTATMYGRILLLELDSPRDRTLYDSNLEQPLLNIRALAFLPDGSGLIYHDSETEMLHVIDVASGAQQFTIPAGPRTPTLAVSPDGSRVAWAAHGDTGISIADLQPDAEVTVVPMPERFADFSPPVNSMAFTPDGTQLIVGGLSAPDDDQNAIFAVDVPE